MRGKLAGMTEKDAQPLAAVEETVLENSGGVAPTTASKGSSPYDFPVNPAKGNALHVRLVFSSVFWPVFWAMIAVGVLGAIVNYLATH